MTTAARLAAVVAAASLAGGGYLAGSQLASSPSGTPSEGPTCELGPGIPQPACHAAGIIRFVFLHNLQGSAQFCRWREANPGEWRRLKEYARTGVQPERIVTWLGNAIRNAIQAYLSTGAPPFTIEPNTAPNACRSTLVAAPSVTGVTPGVTSVTVTVGG